MQKVDSLTSFDTLDQLTSDLDDIVVVSMGAPNTGAVKAASSCCCSACCCCVHVNQK